MKEESIQSAGGKARAKKLNASQKKSIAKKGAEMRWLPRAGHQGELNINGKILPCAVLEDGTRILNQASVFKAFDRPARGSRSKNKDTINMPSFLDAKNLIPYINEELSEIIKPIKYVSKNGNIAEGFRAEILPMVCETYLAARDAGDVLTKTQLNLIVPIEILVRSLSKTGIVALVDEATGYQQVRAADALQAYLEKIISKELAAWVKKFPDEFYENIYKLRGWAWPGMRKNRYSVVGIYTRDLVFERLAPGLLPTLEAKSPKDEKGRRSNKLHQWLTEDIGNPILAQHLHSLIMFQRLAIANGYGWQRFMKMVDQVLPKKGANLELTLSDEF